MVIDERTRHLMYLGLEEKLGTEVTDSLMQHLPPVGWADVATRHDLEGQVLLLRTDLEAQIGQLRTDLEAQIALLRYDIEAQIGQLRTDLEAQIAALRFEMNLLRSDLLREISESSQRNLRWTVGAVLAGNAAVVGAVVAGFLAIA